MGVLRKSFHEIVASPYASTSVPYISPAPSPVLRVRLSPPFAFPDDISLSPYQIFCLLSCAAIVAAASNAPSLTESPSTPSTSIESAYNAADHPRDLPVCPTPPSPHPPFAPSPLRPILPSLLSPYAPLPPPLPPWCPPLALILSEASPTPKRTFSELSSAPSAALKAQVRELFKAAALKAQVRELFKAAALKAQVRELFKAAALKAQVRELFKAAALKAQVRELFKAAALKAQVRELFKAAALKAQSLTGGEPTTSIMTAMAATSPPLSACPKEHHSLTGGEPTNTSITTATAALSPPSSVILAKEHHGPARGQRKTASFSPSPPPTVADWWRTNTLYYDCYGRYVSSSVRRPLKLLFGLKSIRRVVKTRVKAGSFPLDEDGVYFVIGDGSVAQLGRHVQCSSLPPMFIPSPLLTSHSFPPKQRDNEGAMCSTYCGWHDFRDNEGAMCSAYCGWHDFVRIRKKLIKVAYVGSPVKCPSSCWLAAFAFNDSPNSDKSFDSLLSTFAHELAEATSDPYVTNCGVGGVGWEDAVRFDSLLFTFAHELAEATCDSYVLNWYDAAELGRRTPTYAPGSE
ncbi:unnamed protein product [Closterium sp. Naga37s-1]|nr:unnamed protein product [Closterium sp. Naga37s-1]